MKKRLFFDSDVILDISTNRKPFSADAIRLMSLVEGGKYEGFTSSLIFTNIYYVQRKLSNSETAISFLKKLRLVLGVLNVDDVVIQKALESGFGDFEDAVQYFTAAQNKIDAIITRNITDYKQSIISIYTPTEFLTIGTE